MKVKISYESDEEREAILIQRFVSRLVHGIRVHKSERHAPYLHLYLTTKKAGKPHEIKDFEIGRE